MDPNPTTPPGYQSNVQPAGAVYPKPPAQGYQQHVAGSYPAGYAGPAGQTVIIGPTGNCPRCHAGYMIENFSLCGILWLILCFPFGLICFLTMKDRKCGTCGYEIKDS